MKRFTRPFRQLRGKLTLAYTLTSVVTFLIIEGIIITIIFSYVNAYVPDIVLSQIKQEAPQAVPYFVHTPPDRLALASWLQLVKKSLSNQEPFRKGPLLLAVVDTQGRVLVSTGSQPVSTDTALQTLLPPQQSAHLSAVLHSTNGAISTVDADHENTLLAIAPITEANGHVQGALVMKVVRPDVNQLADGILQVILFSATFITIIAGIAGLVFGYLNARGLTRRLKRLSTAADRWSSGDFSALAQDASADEVGQLARQLNRMAEQLQNLLAARQELATLEERNRLARDLHDSVKQQIFAVSMQIGATQVLLKRDTAAAEARLNEAQKLVVQAQQELTSLIRELRPVALEGKGLVTALRELTTDWSRQTDIVANLLVENTQALPLTVEEALFRVAQEALSNVARHSHATLVQVKLNITDDSVKLSIRDNGQGFDASSHKLLGVGLLSMQERLKALGGSVQIESTPGKGTRITAYCPRLGNGSGALPTLINPDTAKDPISY